DFLWQSGLAGTIPSMIAYVVGSVYLYLILRNITHHGSASFIGTLAFMLNPNILYLQSTPLSELESVAFLLITIYYFLCWVQKEHPKYLVLAAFGTFASSLIRYDGWALFLALSVAIIIIGLWRKQGRQKIEANLLIYGTLGILGILLWMWWCQTIFGDFLYFQHGQYSAQAQQIHYLKAGALYAYHNFWQSFRLYGLDATETFGTGLSIAAILAIVVFYLRYRFTPITLVATILLVPFAFYIVTQYFGQSIIVVPGSGPANAPGQWFNVRYGVQMVAPFSFFIAAAIANISKVKRKDQAQRKGSGINLYPIASIVLQASLFAAIIAQMLFTTNVQGILSLDDGLYNPTCSQPIRPIQVYLDQHYNGGLILTNEYTSQLNAQDFGANFKDIIYEGSGPYWRQALANPASIAQWVVIRPGNQEDVVANQLFKHKAAFLSRYSFVLQERDGLQIFRRNDVTNLPDRPISARLIALQQLCSKY
ncbi:MAG TPA: glycosyltransferase family 39 protein, partial [Ktedonobacteraceae bacterium]|nr:glycosyltransferase family 39 protein [Ktedonobacteraceae bacterium]